MLQNEHDKTTVCVAIQQLNEFSSNESAEARQEARKTVEALQRLIEEHVVDPDEVFEKEDSFWDEWTKNPPDIPDDLSTDDRDEITDILDYLVRTRDKLDPDLAVHIAVGNTNRDITRNHVRAVIGTDYRFEHRTHRETVAQKSSLTPEQRDEFRAVVDDLLSSRTGDISLSQARSHVQSTVGFGMTDETARRALIDEYPTTSAPDAHILDRIDSSEL